MDIACNDSELDILKKISDAAASLQLPCYLIGGFVRDKIIGRPTKDIDIVCLGDGIALAEAVSKKFTPLSSAAFSAASDSSSDTFPQSPPIAHAP